MKVSNINSFNSGWLVGNFSPTLFKSSDVEIGHHTYPSGYISDRHYHKVSIEYNYILKGKLIADGQTLSTGDIFIYEPHEESNVFFLEETDLIIIKAPSLPGDKYYK